MENKESKEVVDLVKKLKEYELNKWASFYKKLGQMALRVNEG